MISTAADTGTVEEPTPIMAGTKVTVEARAVMVLQAADE